jgi:3-hydroxymyristoyl/3-hydroxydecanoyl-(acyl carrier protein) dehydratase
MNPDLAELIPHRPPMVMIDALVACTERSATAVKTFREGDYGLEGEFVLEPALVECLAQTAAAMHGKLAREAGRAPGRGLLAGVTDFEFRGRARRDRELELIVEFTHRLGPLWVAHGTVKQDGAVIAAGDLKFYIEET